MRDAPQTLRLLFFLSWIAFLFTLTGCASLRMQNQLDHHSRYLSELAWNGMDPEAKMELLALDLIDVMNESLQFRKASQSHHFLKKYLDRNEEPLNALYLEFEGWYGSLTILEKGQLIGRQVKKPYIKELKKLIPAVETNLQRKIRTYTRIYRFFDVFFPLN